MFKKSKYIKVPKIYREYSSPRVITMSYEEGVPLTNIQGIKDLGVDMKTIVRSLSSAYCKQIFKHGFVHCDPHPVFSS